ncbi:Spy/CpxP family protein refolding chaperone [Methyloferula stellata]|uniref:Spy/CpxP family protein refolding chaperone n=1 Tax=Methyloferula stellata TaxID=876270 RepID=UPI000378EE00|nr:Spy/CpxP family protein refolding chaperone [Methyloferula stellata]
MMKNRFPLALVLAGLISAGGIAAAINAQAQQAPHDDPASKMMMMGHDRDHESSHELSPADRAAFLDARVAALHAGLTLTPDQEKLWPPVETALRGAAQTMADRRKIWHDEPRPADPVQFLKRVSEGALARGEALKKLADAAGPLYATLSDEQKHRLPILLEHLHPHGMHSAMMGQGEHRSGPEGEHHGWWSHDHSDHDDHDDQSDH